MPLDPRTLFAATIVFLLLMSFVSIGIWWTRRTHPGFGRWTVGRLLVVLALILLFLRSFVPDWISVICGNAVLIAGAVLFLEGTRLSTGCGPSSGPYT
jgi:hypothetical protein